MIIYSIGSLGKLRLQSIVDALQIAIMKIRIIVTDVLNHEILYPKSISFRQIPLAMFHIVFKGLHLKVFVLWRPGN